MSLTLTQHALRRCDERLVPVTTLDVIIRYGTDAPAARGAVQIRFDESAAQAARADGLSITTLRRLYGVVLIVDGGAVVTVWRDRAKHSSTHHPTHRLQSRERRLRRHDIGVLARVALDEMEATL